LKIFTPFTYETAVRALRRKERICDLQLMVNSNRGPITHQEIIKYREWKSSFSPTIFWL